MRVPEIRVQRLLGLGLGLGLTTRYELSRGWITNITLRTGAELPNFGRGGGRIPRVVGDGLGQKKCCRGAKLLYTQAAAGGAQHPASSETREPTHPRSHPSLHPRSSRPHGAV